MTFHRYLFACILVSACGGSVNPSPQEVGDAASEGDPADAPADAGAQSPLCCDAGVSVTSCSFERWTCDLAQDGGRPVPCDALAAMCSPGEACTSSAGRGIVVRCP